ncbi:5-methylcytosine-specific restriction protein A [Saccharothrix saharensis]|uniref:5-methylcytosine-specific restriction protein A n=1 Tax=Saccharothrix saharensis TaxID=571190 RepID=A0A543JK66_9PSEU|nr:5-methylcytosine-specific restriction protein A [Saccharothrix saharensis]
MPARASRPCTRPGCPNRTTTGGMCPDCRTRARRAHGTSAQRGYTAGHRSRFRPGVLSRPDDRVCRCNLTDCPDHPGVSCSSPSTVADHWPLTRRELVAAGLDPDHPDRGRGLCGPCHARITARDHRTRGGWNSP